MLASPERQREIRSVLEQCCGSENYYQTLARNLFFTDGVLALAERCGAFWLIGLIASHQAQARRNRRLRQLQVLALEVTALPGGGGSAVAYCCETAPRLAAARIRQEIEFTDFPLDAIDLWVRQNSDVDWVLMLPGES